MASRERPPKPPSDAGSVVILEDMRAQFKVFGEALGSFREEVAREFQDARREVRDGFQQVDQRLGRLETDTHLIKLAVVDQGAELKKIRARR